MTVNQTFVSCVCACKCVRGRYGIIWPAAAQVPEVEQKKMRAVRKYPGNRLTYRDSFFFLSSFIHFLFLIFEQRIVLATTNLLCDGYSPTPSMAIVFFLVRRHIREEPSSFFFGRASNSE